MNQHQKIIDYLNKNEYLTSLTAYQVLYITQFATRIKELEKRDMCLIKDGMLV